MSLKCDNNCVKQAVLTCNGSLKKHDRLIEKLVCPSSKYVWLNAD